MGGTALGSIFVSRPAPINEIGTGLGWTGNAHRTGVLAGRLSESYRGGMRWMLVAAMLCGACGIEQTKSPPAAPVCVDLGCPNAFCNADGVCKCNGETCVLKAPPPPCAPNQSDACSTIGLTGWTMYECNDDVADPADMECVDHDALVSMGVNWISVRCCKPAL